MKKFYFAALLSVMPVEIMAQELIASWYDHGKVTANGERYDPDGLTAAHKTLPFGTRLWLKYGRKRVKVRVNDRGPFVKGRDIDLSRGAARALGITEKGVAKVRVMRSSSSFNAFNFEDIEMGRLILPRLPRAGAKGAVFDMR